MKEASRRATEEGMRAIAEALAKKVLESDRDDNGDDDSDCSEDARYERSNRLEERIHYLKLDLSNAHVRILELERYEQMVRNIEKYNNKINEIDTIVANLKAEDFTALSIKDGNYKWTNFQKKMEEKIGEFTELSSDGMTGFGQIDNAIMIAVDVTRDAFVDEMNKAIDIISSKEFNVFVKIVGIIAVVYLILMALIMSYY